MAIGRVNTNENREMKSDYADAVRTIVWGKHDKIIANYTRKYWNRARNTHEEVKGIIVNANKCCYLTLKSKCLSRESTIIFYLRPIHNVELWNASGYTKVKTPAGCNGVQDKKYRGKCVAGAHPTRY